MTIYDTILLLESKATGKRFPTALFSADTDIATMGWAFLTSIAGDEIVVAQMTAAELRETANDPSAFALYEDRINTALSRDDLRAPWLVKVVERSPSPADFSFKVFSRAYRPPRLLYRDILSPNSLAEEVARVSLQNFESSGGRPVAYKA